MVIGIIASHNFITTRRNTKKKSMLFSDSAHGLKIRIT